MCRGDGKAKVTHIETIKMNDENGKQETQVVTTAMNAMVDEMKEKEEKEKENEKKTTQDEQCSNSAFNLAISLHKNKEENFVTKGISKVEAHKLVAQMANFSKIYANTEGFSVMGGSQHGGIFMRSVCKIFKDTKYVSNHKFTDIIFKIREYTKRNATLNNKLFNFTQLVENEGTLEREVVFGSKYINSLSCHSLLINDHLGTLDENTNFDFSNDEGNHEFEKLCITNVSSTNKIAILVEMEQNRENRMQMLQTLEESSKNDDYGAFVEHGFVIIDKNQNSHEFVKVWNEYYVTAFSLSDDTNRNRLIYDRRLYFNDYLYFKGNKLHVLHDKDILPKCHGVGDESHRLHPVASKNNKNTKHTECRFCSRSINNDVVIFACKLCQESLCKHWCHSLITNKIPPKMKQSKYFEMTIINASKTNEIAVLINIYESVYSKQRHSVIESEKYNTIKDEKEFIDNGFVSINSNGGKHKFKTVWQSACITVVEIANFKDDSNELVFDEQKIFDEYPLYYINTSRFIGKLFNLKDLLPQCQSVKNGNESRLKHSMVLVPTNNINDDKCLLCLSKMKRNTFSCYCQECKVSLCSKCINSTILNQIPPNVKSQQVRVFNDLSSKNKIGVLLDAHYMGKFRRKKITNYKYPSEKQWIKQGFTIIDPGQVVMINTSNNSYYATFVESRQKEKVICDMKPMACCDLIFYNHKEWKLLEQLEDTKCNAIKNESHVLSRMLMDKQSMNNDNLHVCVFCSSQIKNYYYYCKQCQYSLCHQCFDLMVFKKTPLRLKRYDIIAGIEQKTKRLMKITFRKPAQKVEFKVKTQLTNGTQVLNNEYSIEIPHQCEEGKLFYDEIELNINELENEFKESRLNCNVKMVVIDPKNKLQWSFDAIRNIPIFIGIGFDYVCTFTTLNGIGRYGPTNMDEYKGQCHFKDTKLEVKTTQIEKAKSNSGLLSFIKGGKGKRQKKKKHNKDEMTGMQLWTIPKTGEYKVICYGAKGGDSISRFGERHLFGGFGAKVGSIFKLFENDIIKIACGQKGQDGAYGAGGGGGSYFILYKIGNGNPNYNQNEIVNIPLCIAGGGNGACTAFRYRVPGIDGLCDTSENRNDYGGYKTDGDAGRGASFNNDFDIFQSYKDDTYSDVNKCDPKSFLDGSIGGEGDDEYSSCGGFGGGGGSKYESGGGGGGYIGGLVSRRDEKNTDSNKYSSYGALSYICKNDNIVENGIHDNIMMSVSGANNGDGKIEIMFMDTVPVG